MVDRLTETWHKEEREHSVIEVVIFNTLCRFNIKNYNYVVVTVSDIV